jgi:hypothetical protein
MVIFFKKIVILFITGLRVGWDNPIPWDAILLKNVPWDRMNRRFLKYISSHGTKNILEVSHLMMGWDT